MPIINLRKHYPFLKEDCFVEVTDEVAEVFLLADRQENNYRLRTYRHKAYYCKILATMFLFQSGFSDA